MSYDYDRIPPEPARLPGEDHEAHWTRVREVRTAAGFSFAGRCDCYVGGGGHSNNSGRCTRTNFWYPSQLDSVCRPCRERCAGGRR